MRLLVLGAAGRIGGLCVARAAAAGHHVFALARNPAKIATPPRDGSVTHLRGDALAEADVEAAFAAARPDAVITAVGLVRGSPADTASRVSRNVVGCARRHGGGARLVTLAGIQVHDDGDGPLPWEFRVWGCLFRTLLGMGPGLADAARMLATLRAEAGDLDWTLARPSLFVDGPPAGTDPAPVVATPVASVGRTIQTAGLAGWLVDQAGVRGGPFRHAAPALSSAP